MGPVMADRHFQHNFFTQSPLSSTLYITADNNNTSPATPPSSPPSSPSISSGHQGQHQHCHFHQYHSHHDHNPQQHPTRHHNQAQISALTSDQSSSAAAPIPVNDKKASGGYGGSFPPDTYFAHAVAKYLLPDGPSMFGRRSDANCILVVEDVKYYVHVPMLASRSPMFRRIFSEMIDNEAWGPIGGTTSDDYSTNSSISIHDEQHDDLDVGHGYDGHDLLSEEVEGEGGRGGGWITHASTPTSLSTSKSATITTTTTTATTTTRARTSTTSMSITPTTSVMSTTLDADSSMDEDQYDCYDDNDDDDDEDDDDYDEEEEDGDGDETEQQQKAAVEVEEKELPELTLELEDPVGSRFDELLYWIYTDKSDRWLTHFTPQNYGAILQNIAFLNLATPAVLAICRAFEQSPANAEGVVPLGTADGYFTFPSFNSSSPLLRLYRSFP